ncbi:MAG: hypothetical protein V1695_03095 [Candidatus Uhrbacteria bacterium]
MNQYMTPGYAREVQSVVEIHLGFDDFDEAYAVVTSALSIHPGDEHLIEILHDLLKHFLEVTLEQRTFYIRHAVILAGCLFDEGKNEEALVVLERAYVSGYYDRDMIDLMCAVYSRLGKSDKARRLLDVHVDGVSLNPESGTDGDLLLESADPSDPDSSYINDDTDTIDTIQ